LESLPQWVQCKDIHLDDVRQPERAIWPPKPEVLICP